MLQGIIYKLIMLGIPIDGPANILCDNDSVVKNTTFPESPLKKKHCAVAYHKVRETVAAGLTLIYYERSESNLADLFTKVMPANKRHVLIEAMMS